MPDIARRSFLGAATGLVIARPALAQRSWPTLIAYQTFNKEQLQLRPFVGRNVALLLAPERQPAQIAVGRVLSAIDRAWDWYKDMFGRVPKVQHVHQSKATIAEVAKTCGAGCGLMGFTGIELAPSVVDMLLNEAGSRDRYHQAVFYELGRNFWFFADPLGPLGVATGFAHVNRFYSMEGTGLMGAPWNATGFDFELARHDVLVDMLDRYLADRTLTWKNTLAANKPPANPNGWDVTALAAAFFHKIRRDHGTAGYRRFWQLMMGAQKAGTPQDSAGRFVQIAWAATGEDYRGLLRDPSLPLTI